MRTPALIGAAFGVAIVAFLAAASVTSCTLTRPDHEALANQAVLDGRYADAVKELEAALSETSSSRVAAKLQRARAWVLSDEAYRQALAAMEAHDNAKAVEFFDQLASDYPKIAETRAAAEQARRDWILQQVAEEWGAQIDWTTRDLSVGGLNTGLLTVHFTGTCQPDGAQDYALSYNLRASPGSTYPQTMFIEPGDQFPGRVIGLYLVVVKGAFLWEPPSDPVFLLEGIPGGVEGWTIDPSGEFLAVCLLTQHEDGSKTFDTWVIDLESKARQMIGSYSPGESTPYEWSGEIVEMEWTAEGGLRYQSFAGPEVRWEEWRPGQ